MDPYRTILDPDAVLKVFKDLSENMEVKKPERSLLDDVYVLDAEAEERRKMLARKSGIYTASDVLDCPEDRQVEALEIEDWYRVTGSADDSKYCEDSNLNIHRVLDMEILRICVESGILKDDKDLAFCLGLVGQKKGLFVPMAPSLYQRKLHAMIKAMGSNGVTDRNGGNGNSEAKEDKGSENDTDGVTKESLRYQRLEDSYKDLNNNLDEYLKSSTREDYRTRDEGNFTLFGSKYDEEFPPVSLPLPIGHERKNKKSDGAESKAECCQIKHLELPKRKSRKQRRRD